MPILRTDDLAGAVWIPGDGKANPTDLAQSLAKGARMRGATIVEGIKVTGVDRAAGHVTGIRWRTADDEGAIACEALVNCGGQWARAFGRLAGVNVPLYAAEHFYLVTKAIAGVTPDMPVIRDPDGYLYYKEEVGGLVMGGFEPKAKPWNVDPIPDGFEFQLLAGGLGPLRDPDAQRDPSHALPRDGRSEAAAERAGKLHARRQLHPRRSAGARRLFRVRRIQLGRHRERRRRGQARRRVDRQRRRPARPVGRRHAALRAVPRQSPAPRRPHGRDARLALRDALAARGARDGPAVAALAALRPARREAAPCSAAR